MSSRSPLKWWLMSAPWRPANSARAASMVSVVYVEIRTVICSTNAIESLNARCRRAVKARGHFPTEQAAMECLYLVTR